MQRFWTYVVELLGVGGLIGAIAYISWTKMALGSALTVVGAFFPSLKDTRQSQTGNAELTFWKVRAKASGGIRLLVVLAGVILIVGAVADAKDDQQASWFKALRPMTDDEISQAAIKAAEEVGKRDRLEHPAETKGAGR